MKNALNTIATDFPKRPRPTKAIGTILNTACRMSMVSRDDIFSHSRVKWLVNIRHAVFLIAREYGHSYEGIGAFIGGRDHSTVISGCRSAEDRAKRDKVYAKYISDLRDGSAMINVSKIQAEIMSAPIKRHAFDNCDRIFIENDAAHANMITGSRNLMLAIRASF